MGKKSICNWYKNLTAIIGIVALIAMSTLAVDTVNAVEMDSKSGATVEAVTSSTPHNELGAHRGKSKAEVHFDTIDDLAQFDNIIVNVLQQDGNLREVKRSENQYEPGTWYAYMEDGHGVLKIFDTGEKGDNYLKAIAIGTKENPEMAWRFSYKEENQEGVWCVRTGGLDKPVGPNEMGLDFMNLEIKCSFDVAQAEGLNFQLFDADYNFVKEIPASTEAGKLKVFCVQLNDKGNETVLRFFDDVSDDESAPNANGNSYRDGRIRIENQKGQITWADVYFVEGQRKIFVREGVAPVEPEPEVEPYKVISTVNQKVSQGSGKSVVIKVDADYNLFESVLVDGRLVEKNFYKVEKGSTVVTLNPEYIDKLKVGKHSAVIAFTDGNTAETQFTVEKAEVASVDKTKPVKDDKTKPVKDGKTKPVKDGKTKPVSKDTAPKTGDVATLPLVVVLGISLIALTAVERKCRK